MGRFTRLIVLLSLCVLGVSLGNVAAQGQPEGQLTIAFDTTIAPTFLDPAETPGIATPFAFLYAIPATGAAWVVPKKYIEKVGEEGFKRQPIGLGPYRFVSMNPGIELVLEANDQYWRKKPSIKRVVIKGVPGRTTRLAMLKTGEADIGYLMVGVEAATIKADPKLRLLHVIPSATWWMEFTEQWKARSPWHDRRVRLAANLAIDN